MTSTHRTLETRWSTAPGRRTAAAAALLVVGLALAACSSSPDSESSAGSTSTSDTASRALAAEPAPADVASGTGGAPVAVKDAGLQLGVGRSVIRTASMTVEVSSVRTAADRARALAEAAGGGLESEDASADGDTLRLRVAPDRLAATLDALAGLGHETGRTVGSQDVTEQVADLDSRLATQRTSVERVRALLAKATALTDVVAVEGQLAQREAELESLQARAKALAGQADLATVTATLRPTPTTAAPAAGFRDGLSSGVDAFVSASRGAAVVLGALLPFVPLLALALWGARRYGRRGDRSAVPAAPAA